MYAVFASAELEPPPIPEAGQKMANLLIQAGADLDLRDQDGSSALDHARVSGIEVLLGQARQVEATGSASDTSEIAKPIEIALP